MRVGLLGAGLMGTATAHRLLAEGFGVSAWDRTASHVEALAGLGARASSRPEEVVSGSEAVITMLPDLDAVLEVVEPLLPAWPAETVRLQMSSVGAQEADRLVALAPRVRSAARRRAGLRQHRPIRGRPTIGWRDA